MPGSVNCTYIDDPHWQAAYFPSHVPQRHAIYMWHGITGNLLHLYYKCYALLNADEQARANRYLQTAHRQRYVIQHGLLRQLLGWYLNMQPFADAFVYNDTGKPYLSEINTQTCFFNLSSSAGKFVIAIGDREMGVDIAQLNPGFNYQDIISQYFGADEQRFITGAYNPMEAFFLLWTRKEALLKAWGTGISNNLPAVPALEGFHPLTADISRIGWLTESFAIGNYLSSISYAKPTNAIKLFTLSADILASFLK